MAWAGVGGAALALVGCGEEEVQQQQSVEQPVLEQQQSVQDQPQAVQAEQPEQPEQPQPEPIEQQQAQQAPPEQQVQQRVQQQAQVEEQERQAEAQPAPAGDGRRLLVSELPDVVYELEHPAFDPIDGARVEYGEIDGAGYRVELPDRWNGDLVLWAHGFRGLDESGSGFSRRLTFDEIPARELIIGQGFGWATSTYRANGYVPGVGVDDLLRVKDRVAELVRPPRRTFIAGGSMGGATAQLMAQEFPEEVDTALAFCGALGNVWVADYISAWHALAHWLIGEPPSQLDVLGMLQWSRALGNWDAGSLRLTDQGQQFMALIKDFTGGDRWGFEQGFRQQWAVSFALGAVIWPSIVGQGPLAASALVSPAADQPPVDTTDHVYSASPEAGIDLERLNAEVIRTVSPAERRLDPGVGVPTGELRVPLLALKTTGDLFTPIPPRPRLSEAGGRVLVVAEPGHPDGAAGGALHVF